MAYTIRRWITISGMLCDQSRTAKTAADAIKASKMLCGIFQSVITDDIETKIKMLEPGEVLKIKKSAVKLTLRIKRLKT